MNQIGFVLRPVQPFRLDLTVWTLRRRRNNTIDRWEEGTYRRTLVVGAIPVQVAVTQQKTMLAVTVTGADLPSRTQADVTVALDRLLGLRVDLRKFYRLASQETKLHQLAQRFLGMKPPRFPTVFEALVNAIACQQLSLTVGLALLNRLTERYGLGNSDEGRAFPRPDDLAEVEVQALRALGYSRSKGQAVIDAARAMRKGKFDPDGFAALDDAETVHRLMELRGVGRWTAEYTLLRGLGRIHQFPGDDVGAQKSLHRWLRLKRPPDYDHVRKVLRKWRPYAGLVYFHLLLDGLDRKGWVA
ncbi:MAG: DNA-3-methyladenine glycosylase 2 family protein [Nitrospira sp. LK265]|nr:DNA-3-methyladenine glycosylase 2 family protein [Nitrospira sp. LK265]